MRPEKTVKSNNKGVVSPEKRRTQNKGVNTSTERLFAGLVTLGVSEIFYAASGSIINDNDYSDAIAYAKKKKSDPKLNLRSVK